MSRLGWWMLLAFVVVIGGFALLVRTGGQVRTIADSAPSAAPATGGALVIPVSGVQPSQLADSWGDPRGDDTRAHHAIDIMAPAGTPVIAAAAGTVEKIFESRNGGHTVYLRVGQDAIHYYAHLQSYASGLAEGQRIEQGQVIATVGATGDADPAAPHLHFEIKRMGAGDKWWQGTEINPYPILSGRAAS